MATIKADSSNVFDDRGASNIPLTYDGQNPITRLEKGLRERITSSTYWAESCFGINEATLCDRATSLSFCGGTYGLHGKPTPFACLMLKMLALGIEKDIILEYLNYSEDEEDEEESGAQNGKAEDGEKSEEVEETEASKKIKELNRKPFKYLRLLAAWYIRLTFPPAEVYKTLEPLLTDFRKIRRKTKDGFILTQIDSIVDDLLVKDRIFGSSLPKLPSREILCELDLLDERESPLQDEVDAMDEDDVRSRGSRYSSQSRSRSRSWSQDRDSRSRSRSRNRSRDRSYTRSRSRSQSPRRDRDSRDRYRHSRSRSRDSNRRSRSVDSRDRR